MIEELSVRNLGVIEDATLHLSPGLTVVTGETGAGKTLLVTALQLLLGARSDSDLVRHGSDHAVVEANVLSPPPHATEWLEHPDDGLVVVREVRASGGSKARLGGRLVPVGTLQEALGTHVEVHAQHEHHRLTRPDVQRDLLDRFAGPDHLAVLADHREAHAAWTAATTEREELDRTVQERAREQDRLRAELDEIADARIDLEADDRLDDELARVEHADALREGLATASDALSADGAQDPLGVAVEHLRRLPVRDADLDDLRTRAESLAVEAQDLWRELRHAAEAVDADPDQLDRLMRRRQVLRALDRKYGPGLKRVVEYEAEARRRLADLDRAEHSASDLDERVAALDARVHELADRLTRGRQDAGVPVLGVNLGRLGFLAEIELPGLPHALDVVANGAFEVEERATLDATMHDPDGASLGTAWALNEVAIEKSARHRLLHMEVLVGASPYARVPADALLVATVTGSSAYALSAGGPLLSPHVEATLVTPVAPHSLFDRTLVCGPREVVRVEIAPDQPEALVSCDGREPTVVPAGGWVEVVGSDTNVRLARLGELDFYTLVRDKFGLR